MEDVEQTMASRMTQVKESVRNGLDNLTGTYLRAVIRGVHTAVDVQHVRGIDPTTLDAVFARIDEATLPAQDKARLKDKVATISEAPAIKDEDKVIAHFLSKLIQFHTEQQANERHVREFVTLCNRYLTGKQVVYDNTKYTTFIAEDKHVRSADGQQEEALELKMLSSGEKQIVSLFSHLYFSGASPFFVVIDEPELSLSVPWQRRLRHSMWSQNGLEGDDASQQGIVGPVHDPHGAPADLLLDLVPSDRLPRSRHRVTRDISDLGRQ